MSFLFLEMDEDDEEKKHRLTWVVFLGHAFLLLGLWARFPDLKKCWMKLRLLSRHSWSRVSYVVYESRFLSFSGVGVGSHLGSILD